MVKKIFTGTLGIIVNIVIYILAILVIYKGMTFAYDFSYQVFGNPVMSEYDSEDIVVEVLEGTSTKGVATLLYKRGLIKNENAFTLRVDISPYKDKILPGTYTLRKTMNVDQMLEIMTTPQEED